VRWKENVQIKPIVLPVLLQILAEANLDLITGQLCQNFLVKANEAGIRKMVELNHELHELFERTIGDAYIRDGASDNGAMLPGGDDGEREDDMGPLQTGADAQ
jgi:hypothetical protein